MPWPSKSTAMVSRDRVSAERFDGEVDGGPDRSVDAADAPRSGRVDVGELGGAGSVGAADAAGGQAACADLRVPAAASMRPSTTPFCHSRNRVGSVA